MWSYATYVAFASPCGKLSDGMLTPYRWGVPWHENRQDRVTMRSTSTTDSRAHSTLGAYKQWSAGSDGVRPAVWTPTGKYRDGVRAAFVIRSRSEVDSRPRSD